MAKSKDDKNQKPNPVEMTPEEFKAWAEKELAKKIEVETYLTEVKLFSLIQAKKEEEEE